MEDINNEEVVSKKIDYKKEIIDIIKTLLICIIIVYLFTTFLFKTIRVNGISMYPNLTEGGLGFANVISNFFVDPGRFDVVIVEGNDNELWVKRVIGLPNETIEYKDDVLYVDNVAIEEDFLDPQYVHSRVFTENFTKDFGPIQLKDDEYFVMGDNRLDSYDSRYVGPFSRDEIIANGVFIVYPFDKFGSIE